MSKAYYNEHDPFAAAWLRELIKEGLIADGEVDERDIQTVDAADVRGFTQCHWFAGIGGWSYALRLAGWDDNRPVWTGSCPCQPFSSAGKSEGGADDRHLWPHWARLIGECRPVTVFGEQVESAIAHGWLDAVCDDLEREGYACGAACVPAASVGAFHIRQRLWFVASKIKGPSPRLRELCERWGTGIDTSALSGFMADAQGGDGGLLLQRRGSRAAGVEPERSGKVSELAHVTSGGQRINGSAPRHAGHADERSATIAIGNTSGDGWQGNGRARTRHGSAEPDARQAAGGTSELADADGRQSRDRGLQRSGRYLQRPEDTTAGFWSRAEWVACRDGKARPVEPTIFPLAHGVSNRVGTLRGAGNAICPQAASEVIKAYMEMTR